jgi:hypothetical protein
MAEGPLIRRTGRVEAWFLRSGWMPNPPPEGPKIGTKCPVSENDVFT